MRQSHGEWKNWTARSLGKESDARFNLMAWATRAVNGDCHTIAFVEPLLQLVESLHSGPRGRASYGAKLEEMQKTA